VWVTLINTNVKANLHKNVVRALEAAALRILEWTEQGEPAEHGLAFLW
jgi:hypothetical protein